MGAIFAFRLANEGLDYEMGPRSGRVAYPMIARVRLGFRATNMLGRRYIAEIFPRIGGKMEIASASARSILDQTDQGSEFRAFITDLHRRIARSGAECRFEAGMAAWRWWPSVIVTLGMIVGLLIVVARGLLAQQFGAALIILAVGILFLWQMGSLLLANRPRVYSPDAIPADVLPKS
jgi:hypothetical protein